MTDHPNSEHVEQDVSQWGFHSPFWPKQCDADWIAKMNRKRDDQARAVRVTVSVDPGQLPGDGG